MKAICSLTVVVFILNASFANLASGVEPPRPDLSLRYMFDFDSKMRKTWPVGVGVYDSTVLNRKQERLVTVPVPTAKSNPWHDFFFRIYNPSQFGQWMWYRYINTRGLHTFDPKFKFDPNYWEFRIYERKQELDPAKRIWVDVTKYVLDYKSYGINVPGSSLGSIKPYSYYQWGEILVKIRPKIGAKPGMGFAFGCMLYYSQSMVSDFATASVVVK